MAELKITAANFENEVLRSDKPVLLDFYADWCGPCKMLSPILHELAEEKSGALKVGKVNVDEQMELARRCLPDGHAGAGRRSAGGLPSGSAGEQSGSGSP